MNADEPTKVEIVSAEVIERAEDAVEIALDVRISKLEADDVEIQKSVSQTLLGVVGLQQASLKHSVALALFLAVLFFIASRALGA